MYRFRKSMTPCSMDFNSVAYRIIRPYSHYNIDPPNNYYVHNFYNPSASPSPSQAVVLILLLILVVVFAGITLPIRIILGFTSAFAFMIIEFNLLGLDVFCKISIHLCIRLHDY
ncbi:hypothetical protein ACS0TY_000120 [Phlomoides rotata]